MEDAPDVSDAEDLTIDEQKELEESYIALNDLLNKSKLIEGENLKLKEEMNALHQRSDRDKQEFMKYAISEFAADMVLVADNIRRAIETVPQEQRDAIPVLNCLVEGFEVTERSLLAALKRHQVTRFDPLGEPFNPHLHEAKAMEATSDLPANTVVRVIQAGFMIEERVLRPAGVVVSSNGADGQPTERRAASYSSYPASSSVQSLADYIKQANANGSGRYAQRANRPERGSSVLHKPVIEEGQEDTATHNPLSSEYETTYQTAEDSYTSYPTRTVEDAQTRSWTVKDAYESKNYAEAARLQEKKVAVVRYNETADGGQPGDGTLDALLSLSWFLLCAGQYDDVIATADQALEIRQDYISIETNRAHALMLKGSTDEAKAIYNKYTGRETRNQKTWEREVLDDFAELELVDIKHPLMDEIRSSWNA